jgi:PadR family transcriptional regulator AphA
MAKTNRTRYVIMGLLSSGPRSGYDIKRVIEETISHFWSESYGQIYPTLQTLIDERLATVDVEGQEGKPNRKVYTLTEAGRAELRTWLSAPVEQSPVRLELLLKLFFGAEIAPEVRIRHVETQRARAAALAAEYQAIDEKADARTESEPRQRFAYMTLRAGLRLMEAWVRWCDETLAELRELPSEQPETVKGV